jgi:uncharacterized protein YndB with AHSA1/START domain
MEYGSIERKIRIDAAPEIVFDVVSDPAHVQQWWPTGPATSQYVITVAAGCLTTISTIIWCSNGNGGGACLGGGGRCREAVPGQRFDDRDVACPP